MPVYLECGRLHRVEAIVGLARGVQARYGWNPGVGASRVEAACELLGWRAQVELAVICRKVNSQAYQYVSRPFTYWRRLAPSVVFLHARTTLFSADHD